MNESHSKIFGIVAVGFLIFTAYYGSYLPMRKSQIFIGSLRSIQSAGSLDEMKKIVSASFDLRSPIGQEELVRNFTNIALDLTNKNSDPAIISQIINFVDGYYGPIIERGKGMSFGQDLYLLGALNEVAFLKTKDQSYFVKSKFYFEKAHELGPERPQPLYGLLDIYRIEGNVQKVQETAGQILSQWPSDERTKAALDDFLERVKQSGAGKLSN